MTRIYLVRHAEAEGNIYRRAHGHYNGQITDRGYKQIERLRERFNGEHIDAVYSSDLFRACTTAAAVSAPRKLEINVSDMLREVNMGIWEDTAWGDIEYNYPEMNHKFNSDPEKWSVEGSEAYENVKARMNFFITETAKRHDGETIVVFSHGFAIRSFMCLVQDIPSHETNTMPYCDNTAVTLLTYDDKKLQVEYHSCNSHLGEEHSTLAQQTWWRSGKKRTSENLRFMPLKKVCSVDLLRIFKAKAGDRAQVDVQYAGFLADVPVGIVGIDTKKDKNKKTGWISYIHVVPAHRKKTYATQLLGLAISDFRKLKRERICIELPSGSAGIDFFGKYGFEIKETTDTECLMEKDIRY